MRPESELIASLPKRTRPGRRRRPKFLAVDFFCGAGGTTRGLIDAGGYVIAGIDKQESCRRTYVSNNGNEVGDRAYPKFLAMDLFPNSDNYPEGRQDEAFQELEALLRTHRRAYPDVPLLFAICAPCQPFTKLSKSAMSEDRVAIRLRDRSLLAHACRFVARFRPDMVLSENVSGITDARYGGVWEAFGDDLRDLHYAVQTTRVCASDFGIPQYRKRTILAAVKTAPKDVFRGFDLPVADGALKRRSVQDALQGLPPLAAGERHPTIPNHVTRNLSELNKRRISFALPGASNAYLQHTPDGDLSLACHKRVNGKLKTRCFNDVYTRMAPDRPSPTITTHCLSITNGRFGHYDVEQHRAISMREAARLQSFEDDYVFYPEEQVEPVARMIGNAVPPKIARFYAVYLLGIVAEITVHD